MKALILKEYLKFAYEEAPMPELGPDDVLVAVKACGICGSDVHGMDGSSGRRRPPIIMGHEAAGVVARIGRQVTQWRPGDRVTFDSTVYCGECDYCRAGQINLCDHRRVLGVSCEDYRRHGAFADYVAVPQRIVYALPAGLSFEHAALVEPLSIALHAVRRTPVGLNDTAVVIGAGMIGLLVIQALRQCGCSRILAVDVAADRLELAGKVGATDLVDSSVVAVWPEIMRLTGERGADAAIEAVGLGSTVEAAARSVRKGGAVTLVGNLTAQVQLPLQTVVTRELTLFGSCASRGDYPASLELLARGAIDVRPLISAVAPLSQGPAWFERLYRKEAGLLKVILAPEWNDAPQPA
jgi:L-iditol 2-dehydrogenase